MVLGTDDIGSCKSNYHAITHYLFEFGKQYFSYTVSVNYNGRGRIDCCLTPSKELFSYITEEQVTFRLDDDV